MNIQATVSKTALPVRQYLEASVVPILMQVGPGLNVRPDSWLVMTPAVQRSVQGPLYQHCMCLLHHNSPCVLQCPQNHKVPVRQAAL